MAGSLQIKDRTFEICKATISSTEDGLWCLQIGTIGQKFDGENWTPSILHQGLQMGTDDFSKLAGKSTKWKDQGGDDSPHPELGLLYVFGHHDIHHCTLRFTNNAGELKLIWKGKCDVFWDDEYSENLPFRCECDLTHG